MQLRQMEAAIWTASVTTLHHPPAHPPTRPPTRPPTCVHFDQPAVVAPLRQHGRLPGFQIGHRVCLAGGAAEGEQQAAVPPGQQRPRVGQRVMYCLKLVKPKQSHHCLTLEAAAVWPLQQGGAREEGSALSRPVDTGQARAHWQLQLHSAASGLPHYR